MKTPMKVNFDDTVENWRLWGEIVENWIYARLDKPTDTAKLINQMTAHGITNPSVYGPARAVEITQYDPSAPLYLVLPSPDMLKEGAKSTVAGQPYPLPVFYDAVYSGARRDFAADEITIFSPRRVGEYVINACM
jgi:hypothetical protein